MPHVIVSGHGGYATAVQTNLRMLLGEPEGFQFIDFNPGDDLATLTDKLGAAVAACGEGEILFACDLAGGSPFRQCAILCLEHPERIAVAGINAAAYAEMVNNLDIPVGELAELAMEVTRSTVSKFPQ